MLNFINKALQISEFLFLTVFIKLIHWFKFYSLVYGIIIMGLICDCRELKSAFEKREVGAASFALGNATVALDQYLFASYYNPAALPTEKKFQMAFSLQNYFGIGGLNAIDLTTNFNLAQNPVSLAINRFGNQNYQEIQVTAATRYDLIRDCAIGISVQCYILSIWNYGRDMAWGLNFSVLYKVLSDLSIGAMVTNINKPVISSVHENLPQTMNVGFCYIPVPDIMILFEIFQDNRFSPAFRAGFSYQVISRLTIRAGIEDQTNMHCYGLGINMPWINFDYALRNHPDLGVSHIITFSIVL